MLNHDTLRKLMRPLTHLVNFYDVSHDVFECLDYLDAETLFSEDGIFVKPHVEKSSWKANLNAKDVILHYLNQFPVYIESGRGMMSQYIMVLLLVATYIECGDGDVFFASLYELFVNEYCIECDFEYAIYANLDSPRYDCGMMFYDRVSEKYGEKLQEKVFE